jgi:hypothetical protein
MTREPRRSSGFLWFYSIYQSVFGTGPWYISELCHHDAIPFIRFIVDSAPIRIQL